MMPKTRKGIIVIAGTIAAFGAVIFICTIYSRACDQCRNFDITSFFNGYQVPFLPDKILYSSLISCDQRPIVLSSFSMSPQAWRDFMTIPEISAGKEDTLRQNSIPQYIKFQRYGHLVYLYDISRNDETGKIYAKCLIELSP